MSALEKMREVFEMCTVMAGIEPDFECVYITKDATNALIDEAEAENERIIDHELRELQTENEKLRELAKELWAGYVDPPCEECQLSGLPVCADCPICAREAAVVARMRELGIEVDG